MAGMTGETGDDERSTCIYTSDIVSSGAMIDKSQKHHRLIIM